MKEVSTVRKAEVRDKISVMKEVSIVRKAEVRDKISVY